MGDGVTATTAPVFIATVTAILATILQVGWLKLKGAKVEPMLWISLAVIVVFGGLTLWLKMKCSSNGNRRSSTGSSLRCSDTGLLRTQLYPHADERRRRNARCRLDEASVDVDCLLHRRGYPEPRGGVPLLDRCMGKL